MLLLLTGLSWILGGLLLAVLLLLLWWWRRTGTSWLVVRHAFVARMGVLLLLLLLLARLSGRFGLSLVCSLARKATRLAQAEDC